MSGLRLQGDVSGLVARAEYEAARRGAPVICRATVEAMWETGLKMRPGSSSWRPEEERTHIGTPALPFDLYGHVGKLLSDLKWAGFKPEADIQAGAAAISGRFSLTSRDAGRQLEVFFVVSRSESRVFELLQLTDSDEEVSLEARNSAVMDCLPDIQAAFERVFREG